MIIEIRIEIGIETGIEILGQKHRSLIEAFKGIRIEA